MPQTKSQQAAGTAGKFVRNRRLHGYTSKCQELTFIVNEKAAVLAALQVRLSQHRRRFVVRDDDPGRQRCAAVCGSVRPRRLSAVWCCWCVVVPLHTQMPLADCVCTRTRARTHKQAEHLFLRQKAGCLELLLAVASEVAVHKRAHMRAQLPDMQVDEGLVVFLDRYLNAFGGYKADRPTEADAFALDRCARAGAGARGGVWGGKGVVERTDRQHGPGRCAVRSACAV
jgi:hypothetical protein